VAPGFWYILVALNVLESVDTSCFIVSATRASRSWGSCTCRWIRHNTWMTT